MAYSQQDKYEMTLRQARVDIGVGRGNALSKAVDLYIATIAPHLTKSEDKVIEAMYDSIFELANKFFEFNQKQIEADYKKWLDENDNKLRIELGIDVPVINEGDSPDLPGK